MDSVCVLLVCSRDTVQRAIRLIRAPLFDARFDPLLIRIGAHLWKSDGPSHRSAPEKAWRAHTHKGRRAGGRAGTCAPSICARNRALNSGRVQAICLCFKSGQSVCVGVCLAVRVRAIRAVRIIYDLTHPRRTRIHTCVRVRSAHAHVATIDCNAANTFAGTAHSIPNYYRTRRDGGLAVRSAEPCMACPRLNRVFRCGFIRAHIRYVYFALEITIDTHRHTPIERDDLHRYGNEAPHTQTTYTLMYLQIVVPELPKLFVPVLTIPKAVVVIYCFI